MKFFIQFTFYTAMFCLHLLVVLAFYIHQQKSSEVCMLSDHTSFCAEEITKFK